MHISTREARWVIEHNMNIDFESSFAPRDLALWQEVRIRCGNPMCGRKAWFETGNLPKDQPLASYLHRLRCSRCDNKAGNFFEVGPRPERDR